MQVTLKRKTRGFWRDIWPRTQQTGMIVETIVTNGVEMGVVSFPEINHFDIFPLGVLNARKSVSARKTHR